MDSWMWNVHRKRQVINFSAVHITFCIFYSISSVLARNNIDPHNKTITYENLYLWEKKYLIFLLYDHIFIKYWKEVFT